MPDLRSVTRRGFILGAGTSLLLAGCTTSPVTGPLPGSTDTTLAALPLVNKVRLAKGLSPLVADGAAQRAAASQASRMAQAGVMQHNIGLTDSFGSRMMGHGVKLPASENIASGQTDADAAIKAWIASPRHLENMLGNYRGLGVAVAKISANRPYWAMVLSG